MDVTYRSRVFEGETIDGWFAPNLTGSQRTGLGRWTVSDIVSYLKTGSNRFGRVTGSIQDAVRLSTSRMTDGDRNAIAIYLKSLPAAPEKSPSKPDANAMAAGRVVFVQRCSSCYQTDTSDYPTLLNNSVVQSPDPTTLLHVILCGSQSGLRPMGRSASPSQPFPD